jgi:universal stress protein A
LKKIKKILVPTDFSKLSLVALEYASVISELQEAEICLLHVLDKGYSRKLKTGVKSSENSSQDDEKNALKNLGTFATQHLAKCGDVSKNIRRGEPSREIVKFAYDERVDLIIISTHGRAGIAHILMGSVAEKVIRYSPIPVLAVKPTKVQLILEEDIDEQLHLKLNNEKRKGN